MPRGSPPRKEKSREAGGAETRLVYSTGGNTKTPASASASPAPPAPAAHGKGAGKGGVRFRIEKRASGRVVTVVTGLPGTTAQIELLARELRAFCGTGGTARDGEVELQGDQRQRAAAALEARGLRVRR